MRRRFPHRSRWTAREFAQKDRRRSRELARGLADGVRVCVGVGVWRASSNKRTDARRAVRTGGREFARESTYGAQVRIGAGGWRAVCTVGAGRASSCKDRKGWRANRRAIRLTARLRFAVASSNERRVLLRARSAWLDRVCRARCSAGRRSIRPGRSLCPISSSR